jgi:hypothetical protein
VSHGASLNIFETDAAGMQNIIYDSNRENERPHSAAENSHGREEALLQKLTIWARDLKKNHRP